MGIVYLLRNADAGCATFQIVFRPVVADQTSSLSEKDEGKLRWFPALPAEPGNQHGSTSFEIPYKGSSSSPREENVFDSKGYRSFIKMEIFHGQCSQVFRQETVIVHEKETDRSHEMFWFGTF